MKRFFILLTTLILAIFCTACINSPYAKGQPLSYTLTENNGKNGIDFIIDFEKGDDVTILQISNLNLGNEQDGKNRNWKAWDFINEGIEKANPDLIILSGDLIDGASDPTGEAWQTVIDKFEDYRLPFVVIFGDKDSQSPMGIDWQMERLERSPYCIYKQGKVNGNSNFTLLISQGYQTNCLVYALDTCGVVVPEEHLSYPLVNPVVGISQDQIDWITTSYRLAKASHSNLTSLAVMHHAPIESNTAFSNSQIKTLGEIYNGEQDFGIFCEEYQGFESAGLLQALKNANCKSILTGNQNKTATSILYEGVRFTHGLKTGLYGEYDQRALGTTVIKIKAQTNECVVEYQFSSLPTQKTFNWRTLLLLIPLIAILGGAIYIRVTNWVEMEEDAGEIQNQSLTANNEEQVLDEKKQEEQPTEQTENDLTE